MKTKTLVLIWLAIASGLLVCFEVGFVSAAPEAVKSNFKIAVVDIQKIFQNSKTVSKYRDESITEQNKIEADLDKLSKEIEADKAGLKTLKTGSSDYMAQAKEILLKQANLQAQQKFYEQQVAMKQQQMVEKTYQQILEQVKKVADEKKLDVVLTKDELDFPAMSLNEATMMIRTRKVLYCGGCTDITDEVLAALDKEK
jgi:Skp family chaperone for outer membrane proteins